MADSNHSRRADYTEFSDSDPFAELTRIMGHDPRAADPAPEVPSKVEVEDFGFDLEKELMGELDFSEFDEPVNAEAIETPGDLRQHVDAAPANVADASAEDDFEVDHSVEDFAASIMDTFEADEIDPEPEFDATAGADGRSAMHAVEADDVPISEMLERELVSWDEPEPAIASPAVQHAAGPAFEDGFDGEQFSPETEATELEAGVGAAEFEAAETVADVEVPAEAVAPAATDEDIDRHAGAAYSAPDASLEDELNALLSAGDDAIEAERHAHQEELEEAPASEAMAAYDAVPEEQWQPAVNTFGRANFAAPRSHGAAEPAAYEPAAPAAAALDADFADMPDWDDPEEVDTYAAEPVAGDYETSAIEEPQPEPASAVEEDIFTSIFADALAQEETDTPPGSTAAELDEVLSHFSIAAPREYETAAEQSWQPAPAASPADAPAVETIDVAEAAYAVSDDLDLPEIDYGTAAPQAAPDDDFAGDFTHAFGDSGDVEAEQAPQHAGSKAATWNDATPYAQRAAHDPVADVSTDAYALGEGEWQADDLGLGDDFSFDDEFDQALASSVVANGGHDQPRNRRGLLVAAAVVGVAIFGGIGILGMSLFGGGSDTPAMVRADTDPMKVRPENPGGAVVPNQDSEAYNRVSGTSTDTQTAQERLITTAEEPMDIAAESAPASLPTGISEGEEQTAFAATDPAETSAAPVQPKAEDRIEPVADDPEGVGATGDLLAVTPRKVRTMVVRPDGSMVPREMPVAEEETVIAAAPAAIPSLDQASPLQPQEDAGPSVDTPSTVGVVPSQRTEPQAAPAPVVAAQPAPPPVTQTPPATPVSAPAAAAPLAAATSEWSMQIASQPTSESAQATYQDLARRYGNVLEGRGVNIVKADIAGKGTYYRVRIPSASRDEAINLCTRYKSAGGSCFVSR